MAAGTLAGRYELTVPLGRGGMGQVWEGVDRQLDRRVAVKLLTDEHLAGRADPDELVRRFAREASITAGLQHPGVPAVHDAGSYAGGLYLVMELIEGYTVGDLIAEEGPLPVPWAAAIAAQVCAVLAVAHDRGLVHRDLKPQNLMVTRDGMAKVLDFGVATVLDAAGVPRITKTGETIGTPAYMAPEQLRGERAIPHSDLYALGCVLYEMLAGRPVFQATSPHALNYLHLQQAPDPLGRADVPEPLESLVRWLLGKDPLQRPPGAREVFDGLLPFTLGAGTLAGIVPAAAATGGLHMYARALVRLTTPRPAHAAHSSRPVSLPATPPPPATVTHPWTGGHPVPNGRGHYGGTQQAHPRQAHPQPGPQRHRGAPEGPAPPRGMGWKIRHSLWMLPTLSFGLAPWVAFLYIGLRHRHVWWLVTSAGYFVASSLLIALLIILPEDSLGGGLYLMALTFVPLINAIAVNPQRLRAVAAGGR